MKLSQRLKLARTHAGMTQVQTEAAVKRLPGGEGFSQQTISKLEGGRSSQTSYVPHIAYATGVNPFWLAFEIGEMTGNLVMETPTRYASTANELLELYDKLDPPRQAHVLQTAKLLATQLSRSGT